MKAKKYIILLVALLSVGCSLKDTALKLNEAEEKIEQKMDQAENAVEDAILPNDNDYAKYNAKITPEKAQEIALEHADLTAEQVTGLHTEFEIDDRVPHYDVQFRQGQWEYEYEINGETGEIITFGKDD